MSGVRVLTQPNEVLRIVPDQHCGSGYRITRRNSGTVREGSAHHSNWPPQPASAGGNCVLDCGRRVYG
jgi:hypothetical protein